MICHYITHYYSFTASVYILGINSNYSQQYNPMKDTLQMVIIDELPIIVVEVVKISIA